MSSKLTILHGDNRLVLRSLPDNSVDSVVTDPPYGLSKEPNMAEVLRHWLAGDDYAATGAGFMGKTWDSFVPGPATWREVYRVLKPGGYVLSFSGTRTFDMATLALRLAGFEVRDCLSWMHGQGFPKSHNVAIGIDKKAGAMGHRGKRASVAGNIRQGQKVEPAKAMPVHQAISDDAKEWQGWGTALKPAWEPIIVARKPLDGTTVDNVLQWGTGAINIDATRIATQDSLGGGHSSSGQQMGLGWKRPWMSDPDAVAANIERSKASVAKSEALGRWPANVMLSHTDECVQVGVRKEPVGGGSKMSKTGKAAVEFGGGYESGDGWTGRELETEVWECADKCPVRLLDEQSGVLLSRTGQVGLGKGFAENPSSFSTQGMVVSRYEDKGGASRFFYNAKTSKSERNAGMPNGLVNDHPTVKPVAVMEWLIKLVTRPGGVVLDPFLGSGSTAVAAAQLGTDCIGAEIDLHYIDISSHRAAHAGAEVERVESLPVDEDTVLPPVAEPESTPTTNALRNFDE